MLVIISNWINYTYMQKYSWSFLYLRSSVVFINGNIKVSLMLASKIYKEMLPLLVCHRERIKIIKTPKSRDIFNRTLPLSLSQQNVFYIEIFLFIFCGNSQFQKPCENESSWINDQPMYIYIYTCAWLTMIRRHNTYYVLCLKRVADNQELPSNAVLN